MEELSVFRPRAQAAGSHGWTAKAVMDSHGLHGGQPLGQPDAFLSPSICGKFVLQAPENSGQMALWTGQDVAAGGSGSEKLVSDSLSAPETSPYSPSLSTAPLLPDPFLKARASPLTSGVTTAAHVCLGPSMFVTGFCLCRLKFDSQSDLGGSRSYLPDGETETWTGRGSVRVSQPTSLGPVAISDL